VPLRQTLTCDIYGVTPDLDGAVSNLRELMTFEQGLRMQRKAYTREELETKLSEVNHAVENVQRLMAVVSGRMGEISKHRHSGIISHVKGENPQVLITRDKVDPSKEKLVVEVSNFEAQGLPEGREYAFRVDVPQSNQRYTSPYYPHSRLNNALLIFVLGLNVYQKTSRKLILSLVERKSTKKKDKFTV